MASPENDSNDNVWNTPGAFSDESVPFQCGENFSMQFRRFGNEIQLSDVDPPEWERWTLKNDSAEIVARPNLPELSVLCEPESKFWVVPGGRSRVFVKIPITVAFLAGDDLLCEKPTETLSQTWFGELESGELCFWVSTQAHLEPPLDLEENHAIAPVVIENIAVENLEVSRICLRTQGLQLYSENGRLWTSETRLRYQGGIHASQVKIDDGPPNEASGAKLVTQARNRNTAGFVAKTFRSLRVWSSGGFEEGG